MVELTGKFAGLDEPLDQAPLLRLQELESAEDALLHLVLRLDAVRVHVQHAVADFLGERLGAEALEEDRPFGIAPIDRGQEVEVADPRVEDTNETDARRGGTVGAEKDA